MIGIGLGGFMDGFKQGQQIQDDKADRERKKVLMDRQDAEYERLKTQRDDIDKINADAKTEFAGEVAAGKAPADGFDDFFNKYTVPKLRNTYLSQGDIDKADAVQKWGQSQDTLKGARLFKSALLKSQTGDGAGALSDVMEMGKLTGYLDHGYEVTGQETIMVDGKPTGFRLNMKLPNGEPIVQDVATTDLPKLISTFANPEAAWESQLAAKAAAGKRKQDLEDYTLKKGIDKQFSTGDNKLRSDAVTSLRKRLDGGLSGKEKAFDDMTDEEKEALIAKEIELVSGQPGIAGVGARSGGSRPDPKPARQVVMDRVTGQPVDTSEKKPDTEEPVKPKAGPARPSMADRETQAASRKTDILNAAAEAVKGGKDVKAIAEQLQSYGIPIGEWPPEVAKAYSDGSGVIGLGQ